MQQAGAGIHILQSAMARLPWLHVAGMVVEQPICDCGAEADPPNTHAPPHTMEPPAVPVRLWSQESNHKEWHVKQTTVLEALPIRSRATLGDDLMLQPADWPQLQPLPVSEPGLLTLPLKSHLLMPAAGSRSGSTWLRLSTSWFGSSMMASMSSKSAAAEQLPCHGGLPV